MKIFTGIIFFGFNLISIEQHGFVSSKACVTNLLERLDLTKNDLYKHRKLDVLYTDFIKAFDKVYYLKRYYLKRYYLKKFIVESISSWCDIDSGVTQGSVLEALLFKL